jgi:replication-associated recombination protein RarA
MLPETRHGHDPYEVLSALQKSIRRGELETALYWGWEFASTSESMAGVLWNRLHIISSEDIGIADSTMILLVSCLHQIWEKNSKNHLFYLHAIAALTEAPKSRLLDNAICAFEDEFELGMSGLDLPIPEDRATNSSRHAQGGNQWYKSTIVSRQSITQGLSNSGRSVSRASISPELS